MVCSACCASLRRFHCCVGPNCSYGRFERAAGALGTAAALFSRLMQETCALPFPCGLCGPHSLRRRVHSSHSGLPEASRRSETELSTLHTNAPHARASSEHGVALKQREACTARAADLQRQQRQQQRRRQRHSRLRCRHTACHSIRQRSHPAACLRTRRGAGMHAACARVRFQRGGERGCGAAPRSIQTMHSARQNRSNQSNSPFILCGVSYGSW